jgi:hypothetical protein
MAAEADARPTKKFFITNLTRDLTLEDAILDLVDNSVDSYARTRGIDVSPALLAEDTTRKPRRTAHASPLIQIELKPNKFSITDRCGGIDLKHAESFVFRFGRTGEGYPGYLGVYGIGLKRAIFKLGRHIVIESHTKKEGFRIEIKVDEWAQDDDYWKLPMTVMPGARSEAEAGTTITITELNPEVALRIEDETLLRRLSDAIASTYSLFLARFLTVTLNGMDIHPDPLPVGSSDEITPAYKKLDFDGVSVEFIASLATRREGEWNADRAGWYVLCNGRVVVRADKTELTGWGIYGPGYHSKYRGFIGIAFFFSSDPTKLPWTTTKRGLNQESRVYLLARKEMTLAARPVLSFLNNMYPSEPAEDIAERKLVDRLKPARVQRVVSASPSSFRTPKSIKKRKATTSVQYEAETVELERVRTRLDKPDLGAGAIGRLTFEYYLDKECPE